MNRKLSPLDFDLHPRTVIEQVDETTIAIVLDRKSRVIMADGRKIMEKVEIMKLHRPKMKFALKTGAPICRKTKEFLEDKKINILQI